MDLKIYGDKLTKKVSSPNVKVELPAKTTLHACAVDVMRGKPDIANFPACRSRGIVSPVSTSATCIAASVRR